MYQFFIVLLIFVNIHEIKQQIFNQENPNTHGNHLAVNEYMAVFVENDLQRFTVVARPFSSHPKTMFLFYSRFSFINENLQNLAYVHNIVTGTMHNNNRSPIALIGEDFNHNFYLIVLSVTFDGFPDLRYYLWRPLKKSAEWENLVLGIDPQNTYAYVVQFTETFCLDINLNISMIHENKYLWDRDEYIFSQAIVVTENHHLFLLAYSLREYEGLSAYLYGASLSNMSNPTSLSMIKLFTEPSDQYLFQQKRYTMLSISLHEKSNMIVVGIPHLDTVVILSIQDQLKTPVIIKKHISYKIGTLFGKSVAMLDGNTYAVLADLIPTLPWSSSQVQVYSVHDFEPNSKPMFVFPNNQQSIQQMSILSTTHRIVDLISWDSHNIGVVLHPSLALLLPASQPGYCSSTLERYTDSEMGVYRSKPCISGTYQNKTSFGPCIICPPQSKNNGSSGVMCEKCSSMNTSLCFLGAINEIDIINLTSYDQAKPYPESPESTQFDDVLLQNILKFPDGTIRCLFISPVFWAFLTIIFCLIFWIIIKLISCRSTYKDRQILIKKTFAHIDLITEGQFWLGGFVTVSLFVHIIFACKFSISFTSLYPIEQISFDDRMSTSCDDILFNAKFTSSLQLLPTHKRKEKPIFTLLNSQIITLNVQFIGTAFTCNDLKMQQNRGHGLSIPFKNSDCSENNSILNISAILPQHIVTMQFNLIGPHFVGGLRICFSAPSIIMDNGKYTAQKMDYCQFFFTPNETLTSDPAINVKMTKVINRTAGLVLLDDVIYTGLWLPILSINTLTDNLLVSQKGDFYRYLRTQVTLVVDITESEFYMKNTQEPIARTYEITFNTILFSMLCLDLFGLLFIVFKLAIFPLIRPIQKRFSNKVMHKSSIVKNNFTAIDVDCIKHDIAIQTHTFHQNYIIQPKI